MAHVRNQGFDTLICINNFHSNHARVAAAACVKAGIRYILLSVGETERPLQGNLLLVKLMGGEIHRLSAGEDSSACAEAIAARVRGQGGKPYILNEDWFPQIIGTIGFVEAGLELMSQLAAYGVQRIHVWGLVGASLPGLGLLAKNLGLDWKASMVLYSPGNVDEVREGMVKRCRQAAEFMKLPLPLDPEDVEIVDGFSGPAYAAPTDAAFEAIHLVARTEAVILDPNYTGKSMSALIDRIRSGGFAGRSDAPLPALGRPAAGVRLQRGAGGLEGPGGGLGFGCRGRRRASGSIVAPRHFMRKPAAPEIMSFPRLRTVRARAGSPLRVRWGDRRRGGPYPVERTPQGALSRKPESPAVRSEFA